MLAAILVGAVAGFGALRLSRLPASLFGGGAGIIALAVLAVTGASHWVTGVSLVVVGASSGGLASIAAKHLPKDLDAVLRRHRRAAAAWLILVGLAVVQLGRLGSFVIDSKVDWYVGTRHPFWYKHMCLPAYIYGAELSERHDPNIYASEHYIGLTPTATPRTRYAMSPEDPYQYPPPFLLLPRLVIALSDDYHLIYALWYAIQATLFLAVSTWLACWIGGRVGATAAFLLPVSLVAVPVLSCLQYGQFHLTAIVLCVAGMLFFERGRRILGGSLVGFAVLSKIFPGVLLIWLAVRKRWADLAWATAACGVFTLAAIVLLGPQPFRMFVEYQMPRLADGRAFAFGEAWPEFREVAITDNQSYFGIVQKLDALGVPGMSKALAVGVGGPFALFVLLVTALSARRSRTTRADLAVAWLALLGLGSLMTISGWGDYISLPATWLATLLAAKCYSERWMLVPLGVIWIFQFVALGTMPIFGWFSMPVMASLSLIGALLLHGFYVWLLLGNRWRFQAGEDTPATDSMSEAFRI
jgi:alpha-1,2-mannosyltransferase